jgi:hypothetical protein
MLGFDCKSFDKVLKKIAPMFSGHTPFDESRMIVEFEYVGGRRRVVQPKELPRASVSMDVHQGLASCFTTRLWTYLF